MLLHSMKSVLHFHPQVGELFFQIFFEQKLTLLAYLYSSAYLRQSNLKIKNRRTCVFLL